MRWLAVVAAAACGGPPAPVKLPRGVLVVRAPASAALWVDDQLVGEVGRLPGGVSLPAGPHRVELRQGGHHPRYADVSVVPGETRALELTLVDEQP